MITILNKDSITTCPCCSSILHFEPSDTSTSRSCGPMGCGTFLSFSCPKCHTKITLRKNTPKLPTTIRFSSPS